MNKIFLLGNITKETEIRQTENWVKIATTSIATNEFFKDKKWEKQQQTEFHNLTAFWKTADFFENYIKKWQKILVEWKMKTRSWEAQDWTKRYSSFVLVEKVKFLWNKKSDDITSDDGDKIFEQPEQKISKKEDLLKIEDIPF